MVFSSPIFLFLFLPLLLALYFSVKPELRNGLLLVASLIFYGWGEVTFVLILMISIVWNHVSAMLIEHAREREKLRVARGILCLSLTVNLGLIAFYKYANFTIENLDNLLRWMGWRPVMLDHVALPLGISFITFHAMSYVVDVYRGESKAQYNPFNTALYLSMFPQLIAGPIVRYVDVAKQLTERKVSLQGFAYGTERFIVGLAKKVLIANTVAVTADQVFSIPKGDLTVGLSWLGIVCYTLQIYFDFSGYSDMAIGLGHMFGFHFLENFNYPYIARSIQGFWRRWHISLSTWFRDYLYKPLGGNRGSSVRTYFNLITVFFLCGLWHGAAWNFVVWGLFHGVFLVLERLRFGDFVRSLWMPFRHLYVMLVVIVGWVLFRSESLGYACEFLKALVGLGSGEGNVYFPSMYINNYLLIVILLAVMGALHLSPLLGKIQRLMERARMKPAVGLVNALRISLLLLLLFACAMSLASGTYNPFIYYRF